eukprot:scaffold4235_cov114-Isochrysis_galbana.AAC.13
MAAPGWFHKAIQADVYHLLWEREPTFDVEHVGTDSTAYKWIRHHIRPRSPPRGERRLKWASAFVGRVRTGIKCCAWGNFLEDSLVSQAFSLGVVAS